MALLIVTSLNHLTATPIFIFPKLKVINLSNEYSSVAEEHGSVAEIPASTTRRGCGLVLGHIGPGSPVQSFNWIVRLCLCHCHCHSTQSSFATAIMGEVISQLVERFPTLQKLKVRFEVQISGVVKEMPGSRVECFWEEAGSSLFNLFLVCLNLFPRASLIQCLTEYEDSLRGCDMCEVDYRIASYRLASSHAVTRRNPVHWEDDPNPGRRAASSRRAEKRLRDQSVRQRRGRTLRSVGA